MSSGVSGYGTLLQLEVSSVFTTVAEVTNIGGPSLSADAIDMTSHDSTDGYREFVQGLKDAGEVNFDIIFNPAGATHKNAAGGLLYEYEQGNVGNWKIVFPDSGATEWTFTGFITGFEVGAPIDDKLSASVTLKMAGKPTLA